VSETATAIATPGTTLTGTGRWLILVVAFLGWLCAGVHMSITQLTGQAAAIDLLGRSGVVDAELYQQWSKQLQGDPDTPPDGVSAAQWTELKEAKSLVAQWFAWFQCAFLFGAASGGFVLGWLGDHLGRSKGMAASILVYSVFAAAAYFAQSPLQLAGLWYLACLGVGGMWPNGVALVSEAWSGLSRPLIAGVIGTAANIGIFLFATLVASVHITPHSWRWAMLVGAAPLVLGIFALLMVPESPRWLAAQHAQHHEPKPSAGREVFQPPLLWITLIGITLATVPMLGGWGTANWMVPWADTAGGTANPSLKAHVTQARSITGIVGSLLGGWVASLLGRRRSYFLVSLLSLGLAQYIFWYSYPTDADFLLLVAALGFVSGIYFGWLPLFLPELFPTRVRSTGAGVSFNFGRIVTALTIFAAGALREFFAGDYARIGRVTSLFFILGMLAICFAPDTSRRQLAD
jgi:MFS transporter, SHS family, sialic acid transporter